ncbi:MAG: hypothetical protein LBC85_09665 [Fibromonadaceae bacterium]|jgi:hypothetical protein|nr:hypothetical protein [Fibromonadaceae bacterium]
MLSAPLLSLCNSSSLWIYENLTKILRADEDGGNTCFGLTMRLYNELVKLGYAPKLLLGHKKFVKNAHCALTIIDKGIELFLDPGYLIFDPLPVPPNIPQLNKSTFPLQPNWVRLERDGENLSLWTGVANEPAKFRFYFPLPGVSMQEFNLAWEESYEGESMKYLVLNKLDKKTSSQYYYQNGKLLLRTPSGASRQEIAPAQRPELLHSIFGVSKDLLDNSLRLLHRIA